MNPTRGIEAADATWKAKKGDTVKKTLGIVVTVFVALVCLVGAGPSEARRMLRPGLSQSELKQKGVQAHEKARIRWDSLTPEQQAHMRDVAKQRQQQAHQTAEEFWNSLTPEEQERFVAGKERVTQRAKSRWQAKPQ